MPQEPSTTTQFQATLCSTNRQSHTSWGEKILLTGHQGQLLPLYPVNTAEESDRAKAVQGEEVIGSPCNVSCLFLMQNFLQAGTSYRVETLMTERERVGYSRPKQAKCLFYALETYWVITTAETASSKYAAVSGDKHVNECWHVHRNKAKYVIKTTNIPNCEKMI